MRKITIIGGGQAGLQLALGLQQHGYDVTVVSNRAAADIRSGRILSSQLMYGPALAIEREQGLNFWEEHCPKIERFSFTALTGNATPIMWTAPLDAYAQSVDQRVKFSHWMTTFHERGGTLLIHDAGVNELEHYASTQDLVVVASGKGEIGRLFARDVTRSPFDRPMRTLAMVYLKNTQPRLDESAIGFNVIHGVGEILIMPAMSQCGPCKIYIFEGLMGGPLDCWHEIREPSDYLLQTKAVLKKYLPWEAEHVRDAVLSDAGATLSGSLLPMVRDPVATLPSGAKVLGLGDAICVNDPLTGHGANNAARAARILLDGIVAQGAAPFDESWMRESFAKFWTYASSVVEWTNMMLLPPQLHVMKLVRAAASDPDMAKRIANGFANPPDLFPWFIGGSA